MTVQVVILNPVGEKTPIHVKTVYSHNGEVGQRSTVDPGQCLVAYVHSNQSIVIEEVVPYKENNGNG